MESEMAVFRLVRFLLSGRNHNKGTGKTRIWEADTVVSGLKRGGSYQFKAVYEPDDKDGQTYYETVTSEAVTVTIKEDSSTGGGGTTGGGSSSGGSGTTGGGSSSGGGGTTGGGSSSGGSSGGGNTSGGNTAGGEHRPTETKPM